VFGCFEGNQSLCDEEMTSFRLSSRIN